MKTDGRQYVCTALELYLDFRFATAVTLRPSTTYMGKSAKPPTSPATPLTAACFFLRLCNRILAMQGKEQWHHQLSREGHLSAVGLPDLLVIFRPFKLLCPVDVHEYLCQHGMFNIPRTYLKKPHWLPLPFARPLYHAADDLPAEDTAGVPAPLPAALRRSQRIQDRKTRLAA